MKKLIYTLFAITAFAALTPAYAVTEKSWLLVALLFNGNDVVNSKIFGGIPSGAECEKAKADLAAEAKAANVEIWSGCLEVVREKNLGDPKTKQKS